MNNLNSVLIEGVLVRDASFRTTPKNTPICTFTLASNRYHRTEHGIEKEVSFFDVGVWGEPAKRVSELGKTGRGVRVVGRMKQDRWVGKDGKNREKISIVSEHVEFRPGVKEDPPEEYLTLEDREECVVEEVNG